MKKILINHIWEGWTSIISQRFNHSPARVPGPHQTRPVWAIGTGKVATPDQAEETQAGYARINIHGNCGGSDSGMVFFMGYASWEYIGIYMGYLSSI